MKKLLILASVLACTSSIAFGADLNFPTESGWAIAMTEKACNVEVSADSTGTITEVEGGVVYQVHNSNGELVAKAFANSTFIFAKKSCL